MLSDKGGIKTLINFLKITKNPIICISNNNNNNPKIKLLLNYSYKI